MSANDSKTRSTRREAIKVIAAGASGVAIGTGVARWALPPDQSVAATWRFLTPSEAKAVVAIAEQIIPADISPGATDACVVNFIDTQLNGFYARHQSTYRNGLKALQATCEAEHGKRFEDLTWGTQTDVLTAMDTGQMTSALWSGTSAREFFRLLRDHTMQGFYGSPRHGGNRNYISYQMMGLEYPPVIGQNRYATRENESRG